MNKTKKMETKAAFEEAVTQETAGPTEKSSNVPVELPQKSGTAKKAAKAGTRKKGAPGTKKRPADKKESFDVIKATDTNGSSETDKPAPAGKNKPVKASRKGKAARPAKKTRRGKSRTTLLDTHKNSTSEESAQKSVVKFDPLQSYLSEISQYRLLTRDEERELGTRIQEEDDPEAAYMMVTSNLRLVVKIALEFQRVWMQNLLDLIQEGNIGLMQAVKKFDPYKNVKFSYYASFWIKAYILKFIMDNWRLVKIGTTQGQRKLFFKLKKEKQKLIDEGFDPGPKLLSERLGVSEREIIDMDQRLDGWDMSLDAPLKEDSDTERIEFLSTASDSAEDMVAKKEIEVLLHTKVAEFKKFLTQRELEIFNLRIFSDNPVTLQEIGEHYNISRERVRQVEKNIIKKMKEFFRQSVPDFNSYRNDEMTE